MDITGKHVLVTGANRGIGRALAQAALDAGAGKVYAAARDAASIDQPGVVPVALDVTDHAAISALATELSDVDVLINNAGVANVQAPGAADLELARHELEVNYLGTAAMVQAFAPVLAARGGGAIVNILSVASFVGSPMLSTYAASKSAAWSFTNQARIVLGQQGTQVTGAFFGFVDTDLTAGLDIPKLSPQEVAEAIVAGLVAGDAEVLVDERTQAVKAGLADDQRLIYPLIEQEFLAAIGASA
ncbi:MAG: SDR family oxidoreductase [Solirubrobacteraceae bacterium]|nr:SDR family oxidoreductase [Solirubrobacteraceae bacterium]